MIAVHDAEEERGTFNELLTFSDWKRRAGEGALPRRIWPDGSVLDSCGAIAGPPRAIRASEPARDVSLEDLVAKLNALRARF